MIGGGFEPATPHFVERANSAGKWLVERLKIEDKT